ncbi:ribonucleotide-diphosphate reductase alpha subunit [Bacillus sp. SG-1]|nr:ribonucleotide-diphosphate reductase alpha subunit [Bacillus sp. SG-1]
MNFYYFGKAMRVAFFLFYQELKGALFFQP